MNNQFGREVKCSRCWAPWYGYGTICNECRQIEALGEISSKSQQPSTSGIGTSRTPTIYDALGLVPNWILCVIFFAISYVTDWWPIKIIWIAVKLGIHAVFVQWSGIGWDWVWL